MAISVEDGTGVAGANSYINQATAEAYFYDHGKDATAWNALSSDEKDANLMVAAQYVDGKYGHRFTGYRCYSTQGLEWPRLSAKGRDGWIIVSSIVPEVVKAAQAEIAHRITAGTEIAPDLTVDTSRVTKEKDAVGPIVTEREYADPYEGGMDPVFSMVDMILANVLATGEGHAELVRS